ncbi:MAG: choice-of-anchor Q domain-containing protein, partial [Kiritimatiellae bacterium]|nr:choice-of-anchor Q domain-containing protein [Kiritimatiellia bacterium]
LDNLYEYYAGTDPNSAADTDNDGMSDDWEIWYGLDPNDPSDATGDADLDGWTNAEEFDADTIPYDALSHPPGAYYVATNGVDQVGGGSFTNPFATISYALTLVGSGGRIVIFPGVYTNAGQIISDNVLITGLEGERDSTILDCGGSGPAFFMAARDNNAIQRLTIQNCQATEGGAINYNDGLLTLRECNLYTNTATDGGVIYCTLGSLNVDNCRFAGNDAVRGGVVYAEMSTIQFQSSEFVGNGFGATDGGALYLVDGDLTLVDCIATGNGNYNNGNRHCGGFMYATEVDDLFLTLSRSRFEGNSASVGGCLFITNSVELSADNCVFVGNYAGDEGGAAVWNDSDACDYIKFLNCTFVSNVTDIGQGGAVWSTRCGPVFMNSIIWTNKPNGYAGNETCSVSYCCLQDQGLSGTGNLYLDPKLGEYGWRMSSNSICLNAGSDAAASGLTIDIDGESRFVGTVDIGADELYFPIHYVAVNSQSPQWPYNSWTSAATSIQAAIDASSLDANPLVLVSNGIYSTGAAYADDETHCRIVITNGAVVRSVNGPEVTVILGGGPMGSNAIRCAFVGDGGVLDGFSLTNGHTQTTGSTNGMSGGGALCTSNGLIRNCIIAGNAAGFGGGVASGLIEDCGIRGNSATAGGGAFSSSLYDCDIIGNSAYNGGGAYACELELCNLASNLATVVGGGALGGSLDNCEICDNSAAYGGGVASGAVIRCEIVGNSATSSGGGLYVGEAYDCVVRANSASSGAGMYASVAEISLIASNQASASGGGAYGGSLRSCLVINNSAASGGGVYETHLENSTVANNSAATGGGAFGGVGLNSIVYFNTATNWSGGVYTNCCSTPALTGSNNINADPRFVDSTNANYRLQGVSPCLDAGTSFVWMTDSVDYDHNQRVLGAGPDMGAYEFSIMRIGFNTNRLEVSDDGYTHTGVNQRHSENGYTPSSGQVATNIALGFDINYFGQPYAQVYINNNGSLTLDAPYSTFTPSLLDEFARIIAPFWADVDTRNVPGTNGPVFYGQDIFVGYSAFGVTWRDVGYYNMNSDKSNTFQVVLISRPDIQTGDFDLEFNYSSVQWETGDASGGSGGLGGNSARVGFGDVSGGGFELPGSGMPGELIDGGAHALATNSFGNNIPGRYRFLFRNGSPYETIRSDDMSTNPGWQLNGAWAYGAPQGSGGDPSSGFNGESNVIGYNLSGSYTTNLSPTYAVMPQVNCSSYANVFLSFQRWLTVEAGDNASIEVTTNGSSWAVAWSNDGAITDTFWQHSVLDISTLAAGATNVQIRWVMGATDESGVAGGWNLDNVRLLHVWEE